MGDRTVDLEHGCILGPSTAKLTSREVALIAYLARRNGNVVTREELHREVWGYGKRVLSRAVDATVTRLRAKLEPEPSAPRYLLTVWGVGYRLDTRHEGPSSPDLPKPAIDLDRFFGRTDEAEAVVQAFASGDRLVTVVGPPGAGKTRLAARLAQTVGDQLGAQWWWCSLADARTTEGLTEAVLRALDAAGSGRGPDPVASILAARGPCLLVMDNVEQVTQTASSAIAGWLSAAPGARVLATTRNHLRLPGERVIELGPLAPDDARALLEDRCDSAGATLDATDPSLGDLLDRVDRLPLGVELVAAQLELLTPSQLRERLSSAALWLSDDRRDRPERHESLRTAIAASWDLLQPIEQQALIQASVFRRPFDLAAAEAVIEPDGIDVATVLRRLRHRSLLRRVGVSGELQLYESVREHAAERGDDPAARDRHARWLADKARECFDPAGPAVTPACMAWMRAHADDLHAALDHALAAAHQDAVALCAALTQLLVYHGPAATAGVLVDRTLRAIVDLPAAVRGQLVRLRGIGRITDALYESALADAAEALDLAGVAGDARLRGRALVLRGAALLALQRHEEAEAVLAEAAQTLTTCSDETYLGSALSNRASALSRLGRLDDARQLYEDALRLHRSAGNQRGAAVTVGNIGLLMVEQGKLDDGILKLREALDLNRRSCDRLHEGVTLGHLAFAELRSGRVGVAAEHAALAVSLLSEQEERSYRLQALRALAAAEIVRGNGARAQRALDEMLAVDTLDSAADRHS